MFESRFARPLAVVDATDLDDWWAHVATDGGKKLSYNVPGSWRRHGHFLQLSVAGLPAIDGFRCESDHVHLFVDGISDITELQNRAANATAMLDADTEDHHWVGRLILGVSPFHFNKGFALRDELILPRLRIFPIGPIVVTESSFRPGPTSALPLEVPTYDSGASGSWENGPRSGYEFELAVIASTPGRSWAGVQRKANATLFALGNLIAVVQHTNVRCKFVEPAEESAAYTMVRPRNSTDVPDNFMAGKLPDDFAKSWASMQSKPELENAVNMMAQAISLADSHPSIAHLATVSAIETVGQLIHPPTECPGWDGEDHHCESCQKKTGAMRAFQAAVETVLSPEDARHLKRAAYGSRSDTGHSAVLHGGESGLYERALLAARDSTREFGDLHRRTHDVGRAVIKKALARSDDR